MFILKSRVPNTDPCGTPRFISVGAVRILYFCYLFPFGKIAENKAE